VSTRRSGYDPTSGVCWNFHNPGEDRFPHWRDHRCPAHDVPVKQRDLISFGRCRSGARWFWSAIAFPRPQQMETEKVGWADSEGDALDAAMAAVLTLRRPGYPVIANLVHGLASGRLKELNAEKRRQRPPPGTSDARPVKYLYFFSRGYRIIKETAQRIYFSKRDCEDEDSPFGYLDATRVGFISRTKLAASEYWSLNPPPPRGAEKPPDLAQLKAAMAAAHPDRGGSSVAFIAARAAYVEARRAQRQQRANRKRDPRG
jgi:hypothetical protein